MCLCCLREWCDTTCSWQGAPFDSRFVIHTHLASYALSLHPFIHSLTRLYPFNFSSPNERDGAWSSSPSEKLPSTLPSVPFAACAQPSWVSESQPILPTLPFHPSDDEVNYIGRAGCLPLLPSLPSTIPPGHPEWRITTERLVERGVKGAGSR
jgi:hypothetical protein